MPSSTLIFNQEGLTEEILKRARLNFVIKMPNNLFSEQQRKVSTSIFGFTKVPHNLRDEVLFYHLRFFKAKIQIHHLQLQKYLDVLH